MAQFELDGLSCIVPEDLPGTYHHIEEGDRNNELATTIGFKIERRLEEQGFYSEFPFVPRDEFFWYEIKAQLDCLSLYRILAEKLNKAGLAASEVI